MEFLIFLRLNIEQTVFIFYQHLYTLMNYESVTGDAPAHVHAYLHRKEGEFCGYAGNSSPFV